jgi:hypothetical protein
LMSAGSDTNLPGTVVDVASRGVYAAGVAPGVVTFPWQTLPAGQPLL